LKLTQNNIKEANFSIDKHIASYYTTRYFIPNPCAYLDKAQVDNFLPIMVFLKILATNGKF